MVAETFSVFAARLGVKKGEVTRLRKAGRLVLDDKGLVLVEASLERIRATMDPSKAGVVARHAAKRAATAAASAPEALPHADAPPEAENAPSVPPAQPEEPEVDAPPDYQAARAQRERYLALAAKRDYEESMRLLLPVADVERAIAGATVQLRGRLELLPDVLAPQLAAETDEARVRALLRDEVEHALAELARAFGAVAGAPA